MLFSLLVEDGNLAMGKSINYGELSPQFEIEITEVQYNQMNEFPLKLTLDENGKVAAWEKIEIEYEPTVEPPREPTLAEEVEELKQLVADLASLQLGV